MHMQLLCLNVVMPDQTHHVQEPRSFGERCPTRETYAASSCRAHGRASAQVHCLTSLLSKLFDHHRRVTTFPAKLVLRPNLLLCTAEH